MLLPPELRDCADYPSLLSHCLDDLVIVFRFRVLGGAFDG
jgi:hypothetical protein